MFEHLSEFKDAAEKFREIATTCFDHVEAGLRPALEQKQRWAYLKAENGKHPHWKFERFERHFPAPFKADLVIRCSMVCDTVTVFTLSTDGVQLANRDFIPPIRKLLFAEYGHDPRHVADLLNEWFDIQIEFPGPHPNARPVTKEEVQAFFRAFHDRFENRIKQRCLESYADLGDDYPCEFIEINEDFEQETWTLTIIYAVLYDYQHWIFVQPDTGFVQYGIEDVGHQFHVWFAEPDFPECFFAQFEALQFRNRVGHSEKHQAYLAKRQARPLIGKVIE